MIVSIAIVVLPVGAVADDELALAAAERRTAYRRPGGRSGPARSPASRSMIAGAGRSIGSSVSAATGRLPVQRAAERIDDAAEQRRSRPARARHRPCRAPCRRPRSCRHHPAGRSRPGRARAPGRSRTVPCRSAETRRAGRWAVRRRARCRRRPPRPGRSARPAA